jgi:hypothetical protein
VKLRLEKLPKLIDEGLVLKLKLIILNVAECVLGQDREDAKKKPSIKINAKVPVSRGRLEDVLNRASSTDTSELAKGLRTLDVCISGSLRKLLTAIAGNRPSCD